MTDTVNCVVEGDKLYVSMVLSIDTVRDITKHSQSLIESTSDLENTFEMALQKTVEQWVDEPHYFADDYVDPEFQDK